MSYSYSRRKKKTLRHTDKSHHVCVIYLDVKPKHSRKRVRSRYPEKRNRY